MNALDPTSLTPQERELAQKLAQIAPRGEPSPVLDARILATAREAGASPSSTSTIPTAIWSKSVSRPGRVRRRWPVVLGVAASLVLALGVAWRMQPLPEVRQVQRSDAALPMPANMRSTEIPIAFPIDSKPDNTPPAVQSREAITSPGAAGIRTDEPDVAPALPAPVQPSIVLDMPSPQDAVPAAVKAAAPPDPRAPAPQTAGTMAEKPATPPPPAAPNAASQADMAAVSRQRAAPQTDSNPTQSPARDNTAARVDEPSDDVPPATADAPAVRDAWLQRIRSLMDDGNIADARLSVHAFILRYPTYPLPEDLYALARGSTSSP